MNINVYIWDSAQTRRASQAEAVGEIGRLWNREGDLALLHRHGFVLPDGLSLMDLRTETGVQTAEQNCADADAQQVSALAVLQRTVMNGFTSKADEALWTR